MQSFLVTLALAILRNVVSEGSTAFAHFIALEEELKKAAEKDANYDKIKNNPNATREDRRHAEDDVLS